MWLKKVRFPIFVWIFRIDDKPATPYIRNKLFPNCPIPFVLDFQPVFQYGNLDAADCTTLDPAQSY